MVTALVMLITLFSCSPLPGYVENDQDCNDANPDIQPLATEICDDIDNNCNGDIDEELGYPQFLDNDGDGFGDPLQPTESCFPLPGYVEDDQDCDDNNPLTFPEAPSFATI